MQNNLAVSPASIKPWTKSFNNSQHIVVLHRLPPRHPLPPTRVLDIIREVCAETNVSVQEVFSRNKTQRVHAARRMAMWVCRNHMVIAGKPPSFPQIGTWFGRDHNTVMHACGWRRKARRKNGGPSQRQLAGTASALPAPEERSRPSAETHTDLA